MQRTTKQQRLARINHLYNYGYAFFAIALALVTKLAFASAAPATASDVNIAHLTPSYLEAETTAVAQSISPISTSYHAKANARPVTAAYATATTAAAPTSVTATTAAAPTAQAASTTTASATPAYANYLTIAGRTLPIFYSSDPAIDAGASVGYYNGHFLYGHNSAPVFGILSSLPDGATFSLTLNDQTTTYRIMRRTTLATTQLNANAAFRSALYRATYLGTTYDLAIMTCAGTYDPALGTNTHRLILFATQI